MKIKYVHESNLHAKGFFIIEHIPTGRMYVGTALDMGKEIERVFQEVETESKSNKLDTFKRLHKNEPHYKIYLHPTSRIDEAKKSMNAFLAQKPSYLFMG